MRLRVVTYNVHFWVDAKHVYNGDRILSLLKRLDADVIGLQEVFPETKKEPEGKKTLDWLCEQLNMKHYRYCAVPESRYYGNALISRYPFFSFEEHKLSYDRQLIRAVVSLPEDKSLCVCVTHLDHEKEPRRLKEWAEITQGVLSTQPEPDIIMGDFNALRLTDYSGIHLEKVRHMREKGNWEPPHGELMEQVTGRFHDLFIEAKTQWKLFSSDKTWLDPGESVHGGVGTVWATTRIDYILSTEEWAHKLEACFRVEDDASDHFPVVADFLLTEATS